MTALRSIEMTMDTAAKKENVLLSYAFESDDSNHPVEGAAVFENDFDDITHDDLGMLCAYVAGVRFIPENFGLDDLARFAPDDFAEFDLSLHTIGRDPDFCCQDGRLACAAKAIRTMKMIALFTPAQKLI